MSLLSGFDLIYAITQETINKQLQLLAAESVLPDKWTYMRPNTDGKIGIDAELGIPFVDMNTGDASSRKVLITFPFVGGKIHYAILDPVTLQGTSTTADVTGWKLTLTINLSLAEIAAKLISEHKKIPALVKQQLTAFPEHFYDIQHLFLNFEDADLVDSYHLIAPNNSDMNDPNVIVQFKAIVQSLLETLQGTDNPFIFGYAINDKEQPKSNADFIPTGTTYSVYPEPSHVKRSTINFLSVTQKRDVPGAGNGIFNHNWVNLDDVQGTFVIAQDLIMSKLLPALANVMKANSSEFQASGARFSLTKENDIGGHITCTVTPNGGTNTISTDFYADFRQNVHDKVGSKIGYVDGYMKWTTTISFSFNKDNNLAIAVSNSPLEKSHKNHPNTLGKFEQFLASVADAIVKIFSFGLAPDVFNQLSQNDWKFNINADLSRIAGDIKTRLILPAVNKLFFKDAIISPEGHLMMTTTIKD